MTRMIDSDRTAMRDAHRCHVKVLRTRMTTETYHSISWTSRRRAALTTRTLTIVLPESEWQALRTAEPDAIGWLQAQIRRRLGDEQTPKRQQDDSVSDEYLSSASCMKSEPKLDRRWKTVDWWQVI